jgi:hypothetical protein
MEYRVVNYEWIYAFEQKDERSGLRTSSSSGELLLSQDQVVTAPRECKYLELANEL